MENEWMMGVVALVSESKVIYKVIATDIFLLREIKMY